MSAELAKALGDLSVAALIVCMVLGTAYLLGKPLISAFSRLGTGLSTVVASFLDISKKASEQIALSNVQIDLLRQQMSASANSLITNTATLGELEKTLNEGRALYFARLDALRDDVRAAPDSTAQKLDPAIHSLIDDVSKLATQVGEVRSLIRERADTQDGLLSRIDSRVANIGSAVEAVRKDILAAMAPKPEAPVPAPTDGNKGGETHAIDPITPVGDLRP